MPPEQKALRVGDRVSVLTQVWDTPEESWAKTIHGDKWKTGRTEGTVLRKGEGKDSAKWVVDFGDDEDDHSAWARSALRFESRPEDKPAAPPKKPKAKAANATTAIDSSDSELSELSEDDDGEVKAADGWERNDHVSMSQRVKDELESLSQPKLTLEDYKTKSLYEYALHFLPVAREGEETGMLEALAGSMTSAGLAKLKDGQRKYEGWHVTRRDVEGWIGTWMYFLAFPIEGERRLYWQGFEGGFGPKNCLDKYGVTESWFENMQACFQLPTYGDKADDLDPVRRWWDELFRGFVKALVPGAVLNPDESMIQWLGKHMPGFMSVGRKPTDKGAEVHTVCCGKSGCMVGGELFEGKERMEGKEFCDQYQKSTAPTLRLVKTWFGTGKIVVADSWFGSVQTALALYDNGLYATLNVKTAHTGFPKRELFDLIWSNKEKLSKKEQKALGKFPKDGGKRGEHAGFVKIFDAKNGNRIQLLAAGHNAKQPMLLISTYSDLLPGEPQKKRWYTFDAAGEKIWHAHETLQPRVHEFYRTYFHLVDDHNQLRSGTVTFADVWETVKWPDRHFAESLGFWEVNVFKALVHFHPEYKELKHPRFRRLLAHAMLTGGEPIVIDVDVKEPAPTPSRTLEQGHKWVSFASQQVKEEGKKKTYAPHQCGYCSNAAYGYCEVCFPNGPTSATHAICGPSTGRNCMQQHSNGVCPRHGMFYKKPKVDEGAPSQAAGSSTRAGEKRKASQ